MVIVGIAAAVLSFDTWVNLAQAVGFKAATTNGFNLGIPIRIAWLLPIAVDVYALIATRIWIQGHADSRVNRYAAANSVGAIALSVSGNAIYHLFVAVGWKIQDCPPVVIAVGGVPPLLIGLVVHMHTLVNQQRKATIQPESSALIQAESPGLNPESPVADSAPGPRIVQGRIASESPKPAESIQPAPRRIVTPRAESSPVSQMTTDDELVPAATPAIQALIQACGDSLPGEHKIRTALAEAGIRVAPKRAKRIAERVLAESVPRVESESELVAEVVKEHSA